MQADASSALLVVSTINDLISWVIYAKCVLLDVMDEEDYELASACFATFQ